MSVLSLCRHSGVLYEHIVVGVSDAVSSQTFYFLPADNMGETTHTCPLASAANKSTSTLNEKGSLPVWKGIEWLTVAGSPQ